MYKYLIFILLFITSFSAFTQEVERDSLVEDTLLLSAVNPIKVAFYSAVLPGLGQAYNRDYWKIPVVYSAIGAGVYFYVFNDKKFHSYREAFKLQKLGKPNDYPDISLETLQSAQEYHKKYRDLSLLVTIGLYALQIVEASVDAHLRYHNLDEDLTIAPVVIPSGIIQRQGIGIGITHTF